MAYTKGDGVFKIRGNKIYVHGTINGKFYRKSTGKKVTPATKAWIKKANPLEVLAEILSIADNEQKTDKTFKEIAYEALQVSYISKKSSLSHYKDKLNSFEKHILPYFEHISIEEISAIDIVNWLKILEEKLSKSRVKKNYDILNSILRYAKNDLKVIEDNVFDSEMIRNYKIISHKKQKTIEVYTTEEVAKILKNAKGWFKVFVEIVFKYGLRPSETIAIKWEDINLEQGILYLKRAKNKDNEFVEYTTNQQMNKNHRRRIPLFNDTIELLRAYKDFSKNEEWLFVNKDNKPYVQTQSIINYHLKPLLKKLGIKYKTLYAARRSYASIASFSEINLENIQEIMGHSKDSSVTEAHYILQDVLTNKELLKKKEKLEEVFNLIIQANN